MEQSPAMPRGSARERVGIHACTQQNFYLWCVVALFIALFVEMMGTVAFVHLILPPGRDHSCAHLLFNVTSGVFAAVTLFSICVSESQRRNDQAQQELWRKLEQECVSGSRVIDHDTNTFTGEYFHQMLLREIGRTSISAKSFCVVQCALSRLGTGAQHDALSSYLENALAQILRTSLRASDVIAHTGKGEFTVLVPEVNQHAAQIPLDRIRDEAESWNRNSGLQYRMRIRLGLCEYERDSKPEELMLLVSQRCHLDQHTPESCPHAVQSQFFAQASAEEPRHVC